jgi:hypothetical protein
MIDAAWYWIIAGLRFLLAVPDTIVGRPAWQEF